MKKQKSDRKSAIINLLKDAGFKTINAVGQKHIHASGADDFAKSHETFLQSAGKINAFKFSTFSQPVLVVHVETWEGTKADTGISNTELPTPNPEPETDNAQ